MPLFSHAFFILFHLFHFFIVHSCGNLSLASQVCTKKKYIHITQTVNHIQKAVHSTDNILTTLMNLTRVIAYGMNDFLCMFLITVAAL